MLTSTDLLARKPSKGLRAALPDLKHFYGCQIRSYHNWSHVERMAEYADALLQETQILINGSETRALAYAIAGHQIFFKQGHEKASACWLYDFILKQRDSLCAPAAVVSMSSFKEDMAHNAQALALAASYLVVAGTTHFHSANIEAFFRSLVFADKELLDTVQRVRTAIHRLVPIVKDADLMILAETPERYRTFAQGIMSEVLASGTPFAVYRSKRVDILRRLRDAAFTDELFLLEPAKNLHHQVIENVSTEIEVLR